MSKFSPSQPFQTWLYDELDSTNEEAKRLLAQGKFNGVSIIRAHSQTAGKGTQGRRWISPPGVGLYFSVVHLFDDAISCPTAEPMAPLLTLAAGVACAETIQELTGLTIQLKPVNDLYVDGCKLGGILTESIISGNRCKAIITGIGINIGEHESVVQGCRDDERGNLPTSLQACIAPVIFEQLFHRGQGDAMMQELSEAIAQAVDRAYQPCFRQDTTGILDAYLQFKIPEYALPSEIANAYSVSSPIGDSSVASGG
jgi:biotin-[acetyl-CoA-carboxylase] ligase BirA-like protein